MFLAKRGIPMLCHPPYSPDSTGRFYFLFPKLKIAMNGMKKTDCDERTDDDM
jgi:hypothetical protein